MQSTCKDIKNIPNPVLFIKIIFLLALKILKNIHILQYLLYLCKVYPHFIFILKDR